MEEERKMEVSLFIFINIMAKGYAITFKIFCDQPLIYVLTYVHRTLQSVVSTILSDLLIRLVISTEYISTEPYLRNYSVQGSIEYIRIWLIFLLSQSN